jgi:hypothetical protein
VNLYFLVEGRRSEAKVYPAWLAFLLPNLMRVECFDEVKNVKGDNYFLISGGGFPSIYHHFKNAIDDVNSISNSSSKYDYLVLCLDADESSCDERILQINSFMKEKKLELIDCRLKIIVQNRCLETWFMGNRVVYPRQPEGEIFREFSKFYNVSIDDPEMMGVYKGFNSISLFHFYYLREMLAERNVKYTKFNPRGVVDEPYIEQLFARVGDTDHLRSLKDFFDFCRFIGETMSKEEKELL